MSASRIGSILFLLVAASVADANDWPYWRGPEQSGMTREHAVVTSWSPEGENLRWKIPLDGRTTPILMNGRLYAIVPMGEGIALCERIICLDAGTGKLIWQQSFNPFDTDIVENRLGWTSVAGDPETEFIYAHTTGGEFVCLDRDGKLVWKTSLTEMFGRVSGYGGRLHTPVLDEDRVIISFLGSSWGEHAKPSHRYVAFDKRTGEIQWWSSPGGQPLDTTYSTPVVAVIGGIRMLVAGNADGWVYGMKSRTGEKVWAYQASKLALNASAVVDGNHVYITHSEENTDTTVMGRAACIDGTKSGDITKTGEVWRVDGCEAGYASPAIANGRLYVVDNSAQLHCFDTKTGKLFWRHSLGRVGKGSPTVTADGVIYVGEQNGVFHILRDDGDKCVELDRDAFDGPNGMVNEIFGSPIVADGRVYFMTRYHMYCLGKKGSNGTHVQVPAMPNETKTTADMSGTLLVFPAEITVSPGQKVQFSAKLLNHETTMVVKATPEWSVAGVRGDISSNGIFTAAGNAAFSAGAVSASWQNLKASARVRVVPAVPFKEDFESMAADSVPPGWLNVGNKAKIVERDGGKVLQKLATNPSAPFMRFRGYMTSPISGGYAMQADMLGTPKGDLFKPDMGLMNSRYWLTLMGGDQTLRLETWSSMPRFRHEVPFAWKTDVWYRMKFQVLVDEKEAKLRGKVWPRDETEPAAWTIEFTDSAPHREGSAGLYGYSPGTTAKSKGPEVFFDHIEVRKNE